MTIEQCPNCHHPNEGIAPASFTNRIRSIVGARRRVPQCSSYSTYGMGDVKMCGCHHPVHAEHVVANIYDAKLAQID